jgi:fatty acid desaturase
VAASSLASVLGDPTLVGDVKAISTVNNARAAWAIAQEWLTMGATIAVATYFDVWWLYLPAIVIIGARQHALGIIMHDATHYRLFTSRTYNDGVSDLLCAFPIGLSTLGYREDHLNHHRATNTPGDPYYNLMVGNSSWQWPKTRWQAARHLFAELSGLNTIRNLRMSHPWTAFGQWLLHRREPLLGIRCRNDLLATATFWIIVATALTVVGGWRPFLLLWILPGLTFYQLFVQLRWMSEHPYRLSTDDGYETNQVKASPLERFCIAPLNINYHIVHHLFPGTPFYRLPQVHRRLMQNSIYREQANIFENYLGPTDSIWAELVTPTGRSGETKHE